MKALFFIGNKRSGTSLLVKLLNQHPNIYISHESEIMWILYHIAMKMELKGHKFDKDPNSLWYTYNNHKDILKQNKPIYNRFVEVQTALMKNGSPWLKPTNKTNLLCIGDKQPNTQLEIVEFTQKHIPDSRFIHIVRHPADWVESAKSFRKKLAYGSNRSEMLKTWVDLEHQALLHDNLGDSYYWLRYEDVCTNTKTEMNNIFSWLNVPQKKTNFKKLSPRIYKKRKVELTEDAQYLMRLYGYE